MFLVRLIALSVTVDGLRFSRLHTQTRTCVYFRIITYNYCPTTVNFERSCALVHNRRLYAYNLTERDRLGRVTENQWRRVIKRFPTQNTETADLEKCVWD